MPRVPTHIYFFFFLTGAVCATVLRHIPFGTAATDAASGPSPDVARAHTSTCIICYMHMHHATVLHHDDDITVHMMNSYSFLSDRKHHVRTELQLSSH